VRPGFPRRLERFRRSEDTRGGRQAGPAYAAVIAAAVEPLVVVADESSHHGAGVAEGSKRSFAVIRVESRRVGFPR
jgi:hypothetical protein